MALHPLPRTFFNRDPRHVSRALLGKILVRQNGKQLLSARIVEVEAYLGTDDPAAHTFSGPTPRNAVIFGPPGYAYVYFIYGNYHCLNVSCLPDGVPGGVLVRALEPLTGIAEMARLRGLSLTGPEYSVRDLRALTSGPGRLCQAFAITRAADNGKDLTDTHSGLYLGEDGSRKPRVLITPRIGIVKAADKPLRYVIAGNPFVSGPKTALPR
jgi:DNA-3-methyladenine glycosylase